MLDCWAHICYLFCTLSSSLKFNQSKSFYINRLYFEDVHMNWLSCLHFLILVGGLIVLLIGYITFFVSIPICFKNVYTKKLAMKGTLFVILFIKTPRYDCCFVSLTSFFTWPSNSILNHFSGTQSNLNLEIKRFEF